MSETGEGPVMNSSVGPVRVQLSRAKGFRLQAHSRAVNGLECVKVDRTTRWGNPVVVGQPHPYCTAEEIAARDPCASPMSAEDAVAIFRALPWTADELAPLKGKNLACWCKPGSPCHADVLLELANR